MKKKWEPPADADLPEGELEAVAGDELDAMLAERALDAMLALVDNEPVEFEDEDTEVDAGPREDDEAVAEDAEADDD
jgi:hypothetical protein